MVDRVLKSGSNCNRFHDRLLNHFRPRSRTSTTSWVQLKRIGRIHLLDRRSFKHRAPRRCRKSSRSTSNRCMRWKRIKKKWTSSGRNREWRKRHESGPLRKLLLICLREQKQSKVVHHPPPLMYPCHPLAQSISRTNHPSPQGMLWLRRENHPTPQWMLLSRKENHLSPQEIPPWLKMTHPTPQRIWCHPTPLGFYLQVAKKTKS